MEKVMLDRGPNSRSGLFFLRPRTKLGWIEKDRTENGPGRGQNFAQSGKGPDYVLDRTYVVRTVRGRTEPIDF